MELNINNLYFAFTKYIKYVNPFGATVQCYHETFYKGKPFNSENCLVVNNLAGIKNHNGWDGPIYKKDSWEQKADGTKYNKVSDFCKYSSWEECCKDYSEYKILVDYPLSYKSSDNFIGYFCGLFKGRLGKWATDLSYLERLLEASNKLGPTIFTEKQWIPKAQAAYIFAKQHSRILDRKQEDILSKWIKELTS